MATMPLAVPIVAAPPLGKSVHALVLPLWKSSQNHSVPVQLPALPPDELLELELEEPPALELEEPPALELEDELLLDEPVLSAVPELEESEPPSPQPTKNPAVSMLTRIRLRTPTMSCSFYTLRLWSFCSTAWIRLLHAKNLPRLDPDPLWWKVSLCSNLRRRDPQPAPSASWPARKPWESLPANTSPGTKNPRFYQVAVQYVAIRSGWMTGSLDESKLGEEATMSDPPTAPTVAR